MLTNIVSIAPEKRTFAVSKKVDFTVQIRERLDAI